MRVVIVVGKGEQEEVVELLAGELATDARRIGVPGARPREGRLARHSPAGVELPVEELVRPPDGVAKAGREGDPAQEALEAHLVPVPAAVDQERSASGTDLRVAEALEDGRH